MTLQTEQPSSTSTTPQLLTSLLICAYRSLSIDTFQSIIGILATGTWHYNVCYGDALISRARSLIVSRWFEETDDDVFVMMDDDVVVRPEGVQKLVAQCRDGHDIIVAGYPVRNGQFLSSETIDGLPFLTTSTELVELLHAATGCMAVHRRVIAELITTLPKCHTKYAYPFWPLFMPMIEQTTEGEYLYLSEDWAFTSRAREAGFRAWLDPTIIVGHIGSVEFNLNNMYAVHEALKKGP